MTVTVLQDEEQALLQEVSAPRGRSRALKIFGGVVVIGIASVLAVAVTAPSQDRKNMALSGGCSSSTTHYDQVKGVCGWDGTYHDSGLHPGCGYQAEWQDQPGLDTELSPQCCNLVAAAGAFVDDYYWRYPVFDIKPQSL